MGVKSDRIYWSVNQAALEFGIDRRTLTKRLGVVGVKSDESGTYTTAQICAAVFGDSESEKLRKLKAEADLAEMERDERARMLLPSEIVEIVWEGALEGMKAVVSSADIPKELRHRLLEQMKQIPLDDYAEAALAARDKIGEEEP